MGRYATRALALAVGALLCAPVQAGAVREWNESALAAVRNNAPRPTVVSRTLFVMSAAVYDAVAAYDDVALASVPANRALRQPSHTHTEANRAEAASHAAYAVLAQHYPGEIARFDALLAEQGYSLPAEGESDTPAAIGRLAAANAMAARADDGSNAQHNYADVAGGLFAVPYYAVNGAHPDAANAVGGALFDPNHWQPLRVPTGTVVDADGAPMIDPDDPSSYVDQKFLTPHWGNVRPFAIASTVALVPGPPPRHGSSEPYVDALGVHSTHHEAWVRQFDEVRQMSAALDDRGKVLAEFWADGPRSETPPGHWNQLAQGVSLREGNGELDDATLFLALNGAMFDAGIVTWYTKRVYDGIRPVSGIRHHYAGETIQAWGGPGRGTQMIAGETWQPYQQANFVTPAFPEYTSGHSAFSAAAAGVLTGFYGPQFYDGHTRIGKDLNGDGEPDLLGEYVALPHSLRFDDAPAEAVTLRWETFDEAADEAGISRLWGGIHIQDGDLRGREIGTAVAEQVLRRVEALANGALPPDAAYSGLWYDPTHNGEGIGVHIDGHGRIAVEWNTYDDVGAQLWLTGSADADDAGTVTIALQSTEGARFGDAFRSEDVQRRAWGELTLRFTGCDRMEVAYSAVDPAYGSGAFVARRLMASGGGTCHD